MNVTSPGFTLFATFLAAALHANIAKAAADGAPTWPARLLLSAGATMAMSGFLYVLVFWLAVRGQHGLNMLGPVLLALLVAVSSGIAAFVGCVLSTGTTQGARSVSRWSAPLGYAAAASASAYAFTYGW
jgi:hypothetical protein